MPRYSLRQSVIRELQATLEIRQQASAWRELLGDDDALEDDLDDHIQAQLAHVESRRYFPRSETYRKREEKWQDILYNEVTTNDTEFLEHFRVTREVFHRLTALIADDDMFKSSERRTFRGPAELHLMVFLKYIGSYGNDNTASKHAQYFGFGKGTTTNYIKRATKAILKLKDRVITWPDAAERRIIARRIRAKHAFPNCVGVIDGTLLPLEVKPVANGEDYYSRKGGYAVHALITCDDVARIRHVVIGWPGSVHDNRVWSNSDLVHQSATYFNHNEYLLGDSAFQTSEHMVSAYKKPPKAEMPRDKKYFNTKLAKIRIKSEHCIGLIKLRFQFFRSIRVALKDTKSMRTIIELFLCACILTNLLIEEPLPPLWEVAIDNETQQNQLDPDDELNEPVPSDSNGGERREQLLAYLMELRG